MGALDKVVKKKQPKRCLWLVDENEAHYIAKLPEGDVPGERHKIGCFLGSEAANYKTNMSLNSTVWTFILHLLPCPKKWVDSKKKFERPKVHYGFISLKMIMADPAATFTTSRLKNSKIG